MSEAKDGVTVGKQDGARWRYEGGVKFVMPTTGRLLAGGKDVANYLNTLERKVLELEEQLRERDGRARKVLAESADTDS